MVDEDLQRDAHRFSEGGELDPPSGASAGLIDGDQASESGQYLAFGQAADLHGLGERSVGMLGQRAADAAEAAVAGQGQRAASRQAVR